MTVASFHKWLIACLGSGVGGLESWNFVMKGIVTFRVTLLGTTVTYPLAASTFELIDVPFPELRYVTVSFSGYSTAAPCFKPEVMILWLVNFFGGRDLVLLVMACRRRIIP